MNDLVFFVVAFVAGWLTAILSDHFFFHEDIGQAAVRSLGVSAAIAGVVLYQRRQKRNAK